MLPSLDPEDFSIRPHKASAQADPTTASPRHPPTSPTSRVAELFGNTLAGVTRSEILAGAAPFTHRSNGHLRQAGKSVETFLVDNIAEVPELPTQALMRGSGAGVAW